MDQAPLNDPLFSGDKKSVITMPSWKVWYSKLIKTMPTVLWVTPEMFKTVLDVDDTASIQAAINSIISAGGGTVYFKKSSSSYVVSGSGLSISSSSSFRGFISLIGATSDTSILYTGSGTLLTFAGSATYDLSRISMENLRLTANTRRQGNGISLNYCNVITLRNVTIRQFVNGFTATNCTGIKFYSHRTYDNQLGTYLSTLSGGGFGWYGGTVDSDRLGLKIDTNSQSMLLSGIEFDTDAYSLNGANSEGAFYILGGAARITFDTCIFTAQANPTNGATGLLDGGATDITFINPHFEGGSNSPAALKIVNATGIVWIGGRTVNHTTSSIIDTGAGSGQGLFLNTDFGETTKFSSGGSGNAIWVDGGGGSLKLRLGRLLQLNASDDSANVTLSYSNGRVYFNSFLNISGHKVDYGTAAPTTGTWAVGDRVFNSSPSVGNPKSWVCTVAGTPGTWVSEGNL